MLLVDVDAISKLTQWRLLEEMPELVGRAPSQMATVSSLEFRAQREMIKPGKLFGTAEAAHRAKAFIGKMAPLPEPDSALLLPFENVVGIDAGEAILFSIMLEHPEATLLTGDKRALRALALLDHDLVEQLCPRIMVIEQVLAAALATNDLNWLRERVCPCKLIDSAVGNIMGSRCDAPQAAVEEGLTSYINELRGLHDPDLLCTHLGPSRRQSKGA